MDTILTSSITTASLTEVLRGFDTLMGAVSYGSLPRWFVATEGGLSQSPHLQIDEVSDLVEAIEVIHDLDAAAAEAERQDDEEAGHPPSSCQPNLPEWEWLGDKGEGGGRLVHRSRTGNTEVWIHISANAVDGEGDFTVGYRRKLGGANLFEVGNALQVLHLLQGLGDHWNSVRPVPDWERPLRELVIERDQ